MRRIALVILIVLACNCASATEFVRPRPLTEYADLLLAHELDTSIAALNDRMAQCVESGAGNPSECYCRYPEEADAAKASYDKVIQARPKWKGKILFWKDTQNLAGHNLVMPAIENLLQLPTESCGH